MLPVSAEQVRELISNFQDPVLNQDYVSLGLLSELHVDDTALRFSIRLPYPAASITDSIVGGLKECVAAIAGARHVDIACVSEITGQVSSNKVQQLEGVKNVIAVASGKGGVGKSTTTVNLALALFSEGAKVGILDADIYGPSQSIMLGVPESFKPETQDGKYWLPVEAHGLQSMSMGYLVNEKTPMVWRGPMVSGALQQMINQTRWRDLDYLLIDMPPGTGDIQLTLSQHVPVTGAVIVTTPQNIALLDAKKGIEMFTKVNIPVLGIVENMAIHRCSKCGHEEAIFGEGGGERIAAEYEATLLGQLPLELAIRQHSDAGSPTLVAEPESPTADTYRMIARNMAGEVFTLSRSAENAFPSIEITDD